MSPRGPAGGSAADALALLFGEGSATGAPFPATLQEAIGEGEAPAEEQAGGDGDDATSVSLEAALAAAGLDLATGAAPAANGKGTATATDGLRSDAAVASGAQAVGAGTDGTAAAAPTAEAAAATPALATGDAATRTALDAAASAATAEVAGAATAAANGAAPAAVAQSASAADAAHADAARPVPAAALDATSADAAAAPGSPPTLSTAADAPATRVPGTDLKSDRPVPEHRTGDASVAVSAVAERFSAGGEGGGVLDLGTSAREHADGTPAEPRPSTPLAATATAPARHADPLHAPSVAPPSAERADGTTAAPPPPPSATSHASPSAARGPHGTPAGTTATGIEARWGERVAEALRLSAGRGGGEIRLQLEPEGLGHIDVRVHLQADGVRAVIVAEHESTRALLQSQQHVLEDALARSDVRLSGFSVDVGSGGGAPSFAAREHERGGGLGDVATATATPATVEAAAVDETYGVSRVSVRV